MDLSKPRIWTATKIVDICSLAQLNKLLPYDHSPIVEGGPYACTTVLAGIKPEMPTSPDEEPVLLLPAWCEGSTGHYPIMVRDVLYHLATEKWPSDFYYGPVTHDGEPRLMKRIPWPYGTEVILLLYKPDQEKVLPVEGDCLIKHYMEREDGSCRSQGKGKKQDYMRVRKNSNS